MNDKNKASSVTKPSVDDSIFKEEMINNKLKKIVIFWFLSMIFIFFVSHISSVVIVFEPLISYLSNFFYGIERWASSSSSFNEVRFLWGYMIFSSFFMVFIIFFTLDLSLNKNHKITYLNDGFLKSIFSDIFIIFIVVFFVKFFFFGEFINGNVIISDNNINHTFTSIMYTKTLIGIFISSILGGFCFFSSSALLIYSLYHRFLYLLKRKSK